MGYSLSRINYNQNTTESNSTKSISIESNTVADARSSLTKYRNLYHFKTALQENDEKVIEKCFQLQYQYVAVLPDSPIIYTCTQSTHSPLYWCIVYSHINILTKFLIDRKIKCISEAEFTQALAKRRCTKKASCAKWQEVLWLILSTDLLYYDFIPNVIWYFPHHDLKQLKIHMIKRLQDTNSCLIRDVYSIVIDYCI